MQVLDVVNDMLGTMGESPLNTLEEDHEFKGACVSTLDRYNRRIQSRGGWFNRETLTITPNTEDAGIYLPGDVFNIAVPRNSGMATRHLVMRGRRIYNLTDGTYEFTSPVTVTVFRNVPFEELNETAAAYIASLAVLSFQKKYDGDSQKTRELTADITDPVDGTRVAFNREEINYSQFNMIEANGRLMLMKSRRRALRTY